MKTRKINTRYGEVSFYVLDDVYPGLAFYVKTSPEGSEIEFSVPEKELTIEQQEERVCLYMGGYEQGRQRGRWEKSRKLRDLFEELKREAI